MLVDLIVNLEGGFPHRAGRKVLLGSGTDKSIINQSNQKNNPTKENHNGSSAPKTIGIAVAATFLLCCGLICPCFRPRKKDISEVVLAKDHSSSESKLLHFFPKIF